MRKLTGGLRCRKERRVDNMRNALEIIQQNNRLRNDLDSYIYEVTDWGLGFRKDEPDPGAFGLRFSLKRKCVGKKFIPIGDNIYPMQGGGK